MSDGESEHPLKNLSVQKEGQNSFSRGEEGSPQQGRYSKGTAGEDQVGQFTLGLGSL